MQHSTLRDWWHGAVIYQIYPRSFFDSNGDGIGDLPGIVRKMDYIANLGVDAVWISPFFTSPMKDFGYDVSDYRSIDLIFGTMADFDQLLAEAHRRNIKIIIDQVWSHTSDQHAWFQESRKSRNNPKADWYIWADPQRDGSPPNNWNSIFGGTAWQWDSRRGQYYLHNFLSSQPDLNWNCPDAVEAILAEGEFWLERGVDGFRLDAINFFTADKGLRSNPARLPDESWPDGVSPNNPFGMQQLMFNINRPENLRNVERIRALLDRYPGSLGLGEVMCGDDSVRIAADYINGPRRLHTAYTFGLLHPEFTKEALQRAVNTLEQHMPDGWPCWASGNHDVVRVLSRWGGAHATEDFAKMIMALQLCLRGLVCLYQGEELALTEANLTFEDLQDPYGIAFWPEFKGRDGCRTPMPWQQQALHAGFSTAERPWLPVPPEHHLKAVDVQDSRQDSPLNACRAFLAWRKRQDVMLSGKFREVDTIPQLYAFERFTDQQRLLCVFNLTHTPVRFALDRFPGWGAVEGHGFSATADDSGVTLPPHGVFFAALPPATD
jgi:alpha-glucosidase